MSHAPARTLAVLVPVKALGAAKTRLVPLLSPAERHTLAALLLDGVLDAVAALAPPAGEAPAADLRRVVVSSDGAVLERARARGFECIAERRQSGESVSVDFASARLEAAGVAGVLRVPLDLPLVAAGALATVLAAVGPGRQALLVPSRDGTGTNALYRSPPTLFPSRFGPDSRALHEGEARAAGVEPAVLPVGALGLDIDEPDDLAELVRRAEPCPALDWLQRIGLPGRLARRQQDTA